MQGQIEKSSNLQKPDGAQVSISPTESMTLRDVEQGSRKNSLPSNTIPSENNHDEKADNLEEPKEESPITDMTFPEGGWRAWTVVFGAACVTLSTFGYVNSWGAFQAYYENVKFPHQSPSAIAWVGSIQYSLIFVPGIFVGRLFDRGYFRAPFLIANAFLILATFLVPECTKFWQVILCQGILTGLACGTMFSPLLAVLSHWFHKKRGLAFGLLAVGSSVGGTVVPIMVRALIPAVGFKWTMRILGFFLLFVTAIANILIKKRLPPRQVHGRLVDFTQFKNVAFCVYTLSSIVAFLGLYTVLTYIATYATQNGISEGTAYNLVSIANASSLIGRLLTGLLADKYGALNVMSPFTLLAGILTYVWPTTHKMATIVPVTVFYGISSGAFVALIGSPVVQMGGHDSVGERTGLLFTFTALGALSGPPISGAIRSNSGNWESVGYYAGSMIILAVILMWITRILILKHPFRGVI